ncbi:transglycosylase domain-containing protein [Clostridium ljungdahlii]|uniref:Penicillin-binding protein 1A n=1 Tax=Clostridium ljungdahlii (strain ATCC 55383 / DSM 13528 / PETC) TaxID=748727 RepID=D8GTK8_CLOLD|nr:transglycosylase domain-containing protein [Clostridium ljungdahlii]ADK14657.1 predicted penicillin binding protein 1A, only N-term part [Clostridium ljungdahlii DSM 13528]OAA85895.1 Penicillin-binding protein 1F [Clostridium ljungdahlii DSM 13528]
MPKKKNRGSSLLKHLFLSILVLVIIFSGFIYLKYGHTVKSLYDDAVIKVNNCSEYTFKNREKYLNNGKSLYLESTQIPNNVKNAFIVIEDKNFYKHGGISTEAVFRAVYSLFVNNGKITQGGSTIAQQLARNVFLNFDKNYQRKLEEMFIATKLEQKFTKDQVLEFYINNIYFSNNAYGINSASKKFFNKDCRELNLSEICLLVGIPNDPQYYDPIKHLDNALQRKNLILKNMKENNYITDTEYENAINYKIVLNLDEK